MVITPDGKTLILSETTNHKFTAWDIDPSTGLLSNQRVWAELPAHMNPDGCCLDAEGCIWSSSPKFEEGNLWPSPGGAGHNRIGKGGVILETIQPAEGKTAVACCL